MRAVPTVTFYWVHRLEHRISFLWEFHKVHHSDELLNAATFARDNFLQAVWVGLWPAFTIGIVFDLSPFEGGVAGLTSALALTLLSMFYHSAIRVQLPWLDRVIVTPQVHRIHHSVDPAHHNCNFATRCRSSTSSSEPIVVHNVTISRAPGLARLIRHPPPSGERSSSRSLPSYASGLPSTLMKLCRFLDSLIVSTRVRAPAQAAERPRKALRRRELPSRAKRSAFISQNLTTERVTVTMAAR